MRYIMYENTTINLEFQYYLDKNVVVEHFIKECPAKYKINGNLYFFSVANIPNFYTSDIFHKRVLKYKNELFQIVNISYFSKQALFCCKKKQFNVMV